MIIHGLHEKLGGTGILRAKCTKIYPGERKVAAHDSDGSIWRTMWVAIVKGPP